MKTGEIIRIFLLGMVVALLGVLALRPGDNQAKAQMAAATDASGAVVALTTPGPGKDQVTLFLVDPARRTIAYYSAKENQPFSLRQVRNYSYDVAITRITDKDEFKGGGISMKDAEKLSTSK